MNRTRVLVLLPLFVGLAHSFSWDIVVGEEKQLKFYYNGTLEYTEIIPAANDIIAVTYDPVHDRVLFADYHDTNKSISSYDISTGEIKPLFSRITTNSIRYLAYDPVTQLLFWQDRYARPTSIYSFSLKPGSSNEAVDGNELVWLYSYFGGLAVDSCGGFIYWATDNNIERAAFDGSKREVLLTDSVFLRRSLAIDHQTQTMYWTEDKTRGQFSIESADLNGKNRRKFYFIGREFAATDLSVTKDFIYWRSDDQNAILRLPKTQQGGVEPTVYSHSSRKFWNHQLSAANYKSNEQTLGIKSCEALKRLTLDVEERNGSICQNYCFQGNCSVGAERQPICSCNSGYSGKRCEVDACHKHCLNNGICSLNEEEEPVCQCTADYEGDRCDVATTHTGACVFADKTTQQILLEVKQVRKELQCTMQLYSHKLDDNAAKIQICEESMNNNQQNHNENMSKPQTSNINF